MDAENFIQKQVELINEDYGLDQVKDNIYRFFVKYHLPNITIDALIHRCMEMYAEITKRNFAEQRLKSVNLLLSEDYKTGYKEGIEHYISRDL